MLSRHFRKQNTWYRCWTIALTGSVPWWMHTRWAFSRYKHVIVCFACRIIGHFSISSSSGANWSLPLERSVPFLSAIGFNYPSLHLGWGLRPLFNEETVEWNVFSWEFLINCFRDRSLSWVVYCCLLSRRFFALNSKLYTVAKVSSIFVQDEKRVGSMIGVGTFEAVFAVVATTAGVEGTGWLMIGSDDDRNSGGRNHLKFISRGSRPRVPWSAGLFNAEVCLHYFASFVAAYSLSRFATYTVCFLEEAAI